MIKVFHNGSLVRTRFSFFAGFLSESDSHSDSPLFYLQDSCPNIRLLHSDSFLSLFTGFLSVSAYHSDSFLIYCRIPVRISLSFRLVSHLLQETCPYQLIIQTRFSFITGDLSVSTYHSDSFLIYYRIPVRISLSFRLVSHLLQETCPYQPIIQTRFAFIAGFLSELAYHSDPFLIYYRVPV